MQKAFETDDSPSLHLWTFRICNSWSAGIDVKLKTNISKLAKPIQRVYAYSGSLGFLFQINLKLVVASCIRHDFAAVQRNNVRHNFLHGSGLEIGIIDTKGIKEPVKKRFHLSLGTPLRC